MIVCKFGGTSVATDKGASNIKKIILDNSNRKIIVVSAIGKSEEHKIKVTDLLFKLFVKIENKEEYISLIDEIFVRYDNLSKKLTVKLNWENEKQKLLKNISKNKICRDYIVSRGEFFSAKLYSKFLNLKFIDAKDCIIFNKNKTINYSKTKNKLKNLLHKHKKFVIGGYYGADKNGNIITFDRGGSDITGSIIAKLLNASVYENYTDVDGVYDKNPNVFNGAKQLPFLNFKTAIQMADSGNEIVHKVALTELKGCQTLLIVKSTNNYKNLGTVISDNKVLFNDVFTCVNDIYLLKLNQLNDDVIEKIKQQAYVHKIINFKGKYYIILKSIYCNEKSLTQIQSGATIEKVSVLSIFSNVKFNVKTYKDLLKIVQKCKDYIIFCGFLSYFNNFILIFNKQSLQFLTHNFNI